MFLHYLKIAWRNLLKYKTQSVISIVGLAIGFTAFSFTMSWIRYERGYDQHNPDADRIYRVERTDHINDWTSYGLSNYLRNNFPEVEAVCNANAWLAVIPEEEIRNERDRFINDCRYFAFADTAFFSVFYPDIKIHLPYPLPEKAYILTLSMAEKWNITSRHIGQRLDSMGFTPIAILNDGPLHSNVAFRAMEILMPPQDDEQLYWDSDAGYTYIRLHKGTSIERIANELDSIEVISGYGKETHSYKVYPLRDVRYQAPRNGANIKYEALKQFSVVSLLLIICSLVNYIMLFTSRIKVRGREFALNKVSGASNKEVLQLLANEFLIVLLGAVLIGGMLTELLFPQFIQFSMIEAPKDYFLTSIIWYSIIIITFSSFITFAFIYSFVRQTVRENIDSSSKSLRAHKINFTRVAIFTQLCIGILLMFCTAVIFDQCHLMDQRVGYNRNGLVYFEVINWENPIDNKKIPISEVKKIAGIEDVLINSTGMFYGFGGFGTDLPIEITDEEGNREEYFFYEWDASSNFLSFLEIPLIEGRDILPSEEYAYIINKTGNRELGGNAIGHTVEGIPIIGVIPDLQVESPLVKVAPAIYLLHDWENDLQMCRTIVLRCESNAVKKNVHDWFQHEFSLNSTGNGYSVNSTDIDASFKEFTKSERNLLMLIGIITGVAILIAVFGIYSMITLSCNRRRKEIAIRKVNGARGGEIFMLFFREYLVVTLLSCIVAFPIGVYIMQRWLEQYARRVSMEWWLFVGIFILVTLIVLASIFSRVNRAARENPAEVVKSE